MSKVKNIKPDQENGAPLEELSLKNKFKEKVETQNLRKLHLYEDRLRIIEKSKRLAKKAEELENHLNRHITLRDRYYFSRNIIEVISNFMEPIERTQIEIEDNIKKHAGLFFKSSVDYSNHHQIPSTLSEELKREIIEQNIIKENQYKSEIQIKYDTLSESEAVIFKKELGVLNRSLIRAINDRNSSSNEKVIKDITNHISEVLKRKSTFLLKYKDYLEWLSHQFPKLEPDEYMTLRKDFEKRIDKQNLNMVIQYEDNLRIKEELKKSDQLLENFYNELDRRIDYLSYSFNEFKEESIIHHTIKSIENSLKKLDKEVKRLKLIFFKSEDNNSIHPERLTFPIPDDLKGKIKKQNQKIESQYDIGRHMIRSLSENSSLSAFKKRLEELNIDLIGRLDQRKALKNEQDVEEITKHIEEIIKYKHNLFEKWKTVSIISLPYTSGSALLAESISTSNVVGTINLLAYTEEASLPLTPRPTSRQ